MSRKKPIKVNINDTIEIEPVGVYESKVVKSGNGAVINFYKKFLGQGVFVLVKKHIKDEDVISSDEKENKKLAEKWYKNSP